MSGYSGFSKSNNALVAEAEGRMTATAAGKALGVSAAAVAACVETSEWHHTSAKFNETKYYDVADLLAVKAGKFTGGADEFVEVEATFAAMRAFDAKRKSCQTIIYVGCSVTYLEWVGTARHTRATEIQLTNCQVTDSGKAMLEILTADGKSFKKSRKTRGLKIDLADGSILVRNY